MTHETTMTTKDAQTKQEDAPNAVFPPFQRGRTGRKGVSKYIQIETGSWVTLNPDGSCHIGARHKYLGNLLEVAGELGQRKEYAEAWRIHMLRAERERDKVIGLLRACVEDHARSSYSKPVWDAAIAYLHGVADSVKALWLAESPTIPGYYPPRQAPPIW